MLKCHYPSVGSSGVARISVPSLGPLIFNGISESTTRGRNFVLKISSSEGGFLVLTPKGGIAPVIAGSIELRERGGAPSRRTLGAAFGAVAPLAPPRGWPCPDEYSSCPKEIYQALKTRSDRSLREVQLMTDIRSPSHSVADGSCTYSKSRNSQPL